MQNFLKLYTGETFKRSVALLDTDVTVKFAYTFINDPLGAITTLDCTIANSFASIELTPDKTLVPGEYKYEFRSKSNTTDETNSIEIGRFKIYNSLLKNI